MNRNPGGEKERGWSLPFTTILLVVVGVLTYFYGWRVLVIVAALFGAITLGTFIYDKFFSKPYDYEWMEGLVPVPDFMQQANRCAKCGATNFGMFVHYGSYVLRCFECGTAGPATSFMAIESDLTGRFQAVLVDETMKEKQILAEGTCPEIAGKVEEEADKGNWVWLRPIGGAS